MRYTKNLTSALFGTKAENTQPMKLNGYLTVCHPHSQILRHVMTAKNLIASDASGKGEKSMNDLISRREAIDGLDGHWVERRSLNDWQEGWNAALEWVQGFYLEDLPSAQPTYTGAKPDCIDCINVGGDWNCDHVHCRKGTGTSAQPERDLDEWCSDCKEYDSDRHCCPRWNRVIRETLKDAQQWIPCKWHTKEENLPKECKSVLVCIEENSGYKIGVSYRTDYNRWEGYGRANVVAWMPLPEPWKGEQP